MKSNVVFFDLDYTLVGRNSTLDFIEYVLKRKLNSYNILFLLILRISFLLHPLLKWIFPSFGAKSFIFILSTLHKKEISRLAKDFINENKGKINKQVYLELKKHQKRGDKIFLLTSVFEEIAYEYSLIFRTDGIFASKLEYKNNMCTGQIKENLEDNKRDVLKSYIQGNNICKSTIYTDNLEDYVLREYVDDFIGISNSMYAYFLWKGKNVKTINLFKKQINKWIFYIPGAYFISLRTTLPNFLIYRVLFVLLVLFILDKVSPIIILSWLAFISLYEIGYFINDTFSIEIESHTSARLVPIEKFFKQKFILCHLGWAGLFHFLLLFMTISKLFFFINFFIVGVFMLHNLFPPKKRLPTYTLLKMSHIIVPLSSLIIISDLFIVSLSMLLFYIPKHLFSYYHRHTSGKIIEKKKRQKILNVQILFFSIIILSILLINVSPLWFISAYFLIIESLLLLR